MTGRLAVLLYGEVVGYLQRAAEGADPTFTYEQAYLRDARTALSARLPLRSVTFTSDRVVPYLRGLLPENDQTRERWAARLGISPDDTFSILARMGWDCPGAVQFCAADDVDHLRLRGTSYLPVTEADIAQRLRRLVDDPATWTMPDEHWSLAGQQEKFALAWRGGGWHEAHEAAVTTHIFKPGIRALHHQALVEHVTMVAAAAVGIDIAGTRLMQFEDQWAIVVDRFDRLTDVADGIQRFHQEDFCQALGRLPANKYESRGGPRLSDMMRLLRQESTSMRDDRLALADFLIINVVAGAPDGHSKNISMLRAPGTCWVAPLYDLATGLAYDSDRVDRSVALSVGGERQLSRIGPQQWEKAARILTLDEGEVRAKVRHLAASFTDAFADALDLVRHAPGARDVRRRALPALASHCARVLGSTAAK